MRVGWLYRRCNGRAKPTLWQSGSVPPAGAAFCGEVRPEIRTQRRRLPAGNEGAAVVNCGMLPCPRRHLEDREYRRRSQ